MTKAVVGLTKIGKWGRWHQVLSNGESRPCSMIWTIMPKGIRSYCLWMRYYNRQMKGSFDAMLRKRKEMNVTDDRCKSR